MFVTLATEKVQSLLAEEALKAGGESVGAEGKERWGRKRGEKGVSGGKQSGVVKVLVALGVKECRSLRIRLTQ